MPVEMDLTLKIDIENQHQIHMKNKSIDLETVLTVAVC